MSDNDPVELNAKAMRRKILNSLGLPDAERIPTLGRIKEEIQGTSYGPEFERAMAAGEVQQPELPEELKELVEVDPEALSQGEFSPEKGVEGAPDFPLRRPVCVEHVPMAKILPCICGRDHRSPDQKIISLARKPGSELPPIQCSCGRVIVGYVPLIEVKSH